VQDRPRVEGRHDVEAREVRDPVRVVESRAERDEGAAVVPYESEPVVPERRGEADHVGAHRALGVDVGRRRLRLGAGAVPAQVRADHRVTLGEERRDVPPHRAGLGEAVQEDDR
jgi:hypothetical protein